MKGIDTALLELLTPLMSTQKEAKLRAVGSCNHTSERSKFAMKVFVGGPSGPKQRTLATIAVHSQAFA